MGSSKYAILITLYSILVKSEKHYIVPSVDKILLLLEKYHKTTIHRRWFFYCLKYLKDEGFIVTKHRFKHYTQNLIQQLPSMITFTLRGASYLMKKRVAGAKALLKTILSWMGKGDRRFPKPKEFDVVMSENDINRNRVRLQELLALIE